MSALRNCRVLALTLVLFSGASRAATHTWTGTVSSGWANAGNWTGGSPVTDVSGSIQLVFPSGAATLSNNDVTGLTIQSITFTGPAGNDTRLTGNPLVLTGGLTVDGTVLSGIPTVSLPLVLAFSQTFMVTTPVGRLKLDGTISGPPNPVLTYAGAGSIEVDGNNDYQGATMIVGVGLQVTGGHPSFLGSPLIGTLVQAGAYLNFSPAASGCPEPLFMEGTSYLVGLSGVPPVSIFTGQITLTSSGLGGVNVGVGIGQAVALTGAVTGANGIAASGAGGSILILTHVNDYSGPTTVSYNGVVGGPPFKLQVDGAQAGSDVLVNSNTILGGNGVVGSVAAKEGSTVSPGASPGILSIGGNLAMTVNSTLAIEMIGASPGAGGYDQLGVSGSINLGGAGLNLAVGFSPGILSAFTIIHNVGGFPVVGTFAGLPENSGLVSGGTEFRINYNVVAVGATNDVVLTTIGAPPSVTASPAMSTYCPGGPAVPLTATPSGGTGSYTGYQWYLGASPVGTGSTYNATAAGTYTVTVTDSIGVTSAPSAGAIVVLESTPPVVTAPGDAVVTQTLCM